jgi:hypothetical protein
MSNSHRKGAAKTLGSDQRKEERFEEILKGLANIPDLPPPGTVITPRAIPGVATDYRYKDSIKRMHEHYREIFDKCTEADMIWLRQLLLRAWTSADPGEKEWFVFLFRKFHADVMRRAQSFQDDAGEKLLRDCRHRNATLSEFFATPEKSGPLDMTIAELLYHLVDSDQIEEARTALKDGPPPRSEFEEIAFYLQRNLTRAVRCQNPDCPAPFFFTKNKQRYCCGDCAEYGQRESKKKWWRENRGRGPKKRGKK